MFHTDTFPLHPDVLWSRGRALPLARNSLFPLSSPRRLQADSQVDLVRQHFYEVSLEYVFKVQEVQERKMFEFVEPVSERSSCLHLQKVGGCVEKRGLVGSWAAAWGIPAAG